VIVLTDEETEIPDQGR